MNTQAILCLQCGGPLGAVKAIPAVVECGFCGAVISVGERPVVTRAGTPDELRTNRMRDGRVKFIEELNRLLAQKTAPFEAVRTAAAHHLGTGGETDALARVTIALARDFEAEHRGLDAVGDANVLCRVAEAYLRCIHDLQGSAEVEMSMPFIAVTSAGPVHFLRRLTAQDLATLAARDPHAPPTAQPREAPVASAPTADAPKKKWWQFGG